MHDFLIEAKWRLQSHWNGRYLYNYGPYNCIITNGKVYLGEHSSKCVSMPTPTAEYKHRFWELIEKMKAGANEQWP